MNKLLDGIIDNLLAKAKQADVKAVNETSLLLKDYIFNRNIKTITTEQNSSINTIVHNIEENYIPSKLSRGEVKDCRLLMNASEILRMVLDKVNVDEGKVGFSIDGVTITNGKLTNKAEKLLDESINGKVLITTYDQSNRGSGKSKALIVKANELDCTLVTHNYTSKRYLDELAQNLNIPVEVKYYNTVDSARGSRLRSGKFLVDEGVSKDIILKFIDDGNELLGGFIDLHTKEVVNLTSKIKSKLNELENELWVFHKLYGDYSKNKYEYIDVLNKVNALKWLLNELK